MLPKLNNEYVNYLGPQLYSPVPRYGGKSDLTATIIGLFQSHNLYIEPYCGGAQVLLRKLPSNHEIIGDTHRDIVNFFTQLRDQSAALIELVNPIRHTRESFDRAGILLQTSTDPLTRAAAYFIRCRLSISKYGCTYAPPHPTNPGPNVPDNARIFENSKSHLPAVAARLRNVNILNKSALHIVNAVKHYSIITTLYIDPTYLADTRVSKDYYADHEMTVDDHILLLQAIKAHPHQVIISGYDHPLYREFLSGWGRVDKQVRTSGCSGPKSKPKRTEVIWHNR
jgi:DNA adenine methylase